MSEALTLELPDDLAARAREIANLSSRPLGDVVLDWIRAGSDEPNIELLPDDKVLSLGNSMLPEHEQQ